LSPPLFIFSKEIEGVFSMNLENMDILAQKVEKVLDALRRVKAEKAQVQVEARQMLEKAQAQLAAKDRELEELYARLESRSNELQSLNNVVKNQGEEIQLAQERFQQLLNTIEAELGTEIPIAPKAPEMVEGSVVENKPEVEEVKQNDFFG